MSVTSTGALRLRICRASRRAHSKPVKPPPTTTTELMCVTVSAATTRNGRSSDAPGALRGLVHRTKNHRHHGFVVPAQPPRTLVREPLHPKDGRFVEGVTRAREMRCNDPPYDSSLIAQRCGQHRADPGPQHRFAVLLREHR